MAGLPIGVGFRPTKLQLVNYFLRIKHSGQVLPAWHPQFIIDFDVYTDHPFNILASTKERRGVNDVNEGFFFSRLNKLTTPNGKRIISRCIKGIGTWSEKSRTNTVCIGNRVVGIEKYLKFKPERRSNNNNNDEKEDEWIMREYSRLGKDDEKEDDEMVVLCHITKKPDSTKDDDESRRRLKRSQTTYAAAIMPIDYQVSSSKRSRIEYEQPSSGCNNSGIINLNQDYVSRAVDEGYQVEYCRVPQGNINSAVMEPSKEAYVEDLQGMLSLSNGAQEGDVCQPIHTRVQDAEQAFGSLDDSWTGCDVATNAIGLDKLDEAFSTYT